LTVFRRELHEFPPAEVQLMAAFADQAALAMENARLYDLAQRQAAELEQRVADSTAELREANAELEMFTYSVSHDLLAPLWLIQGFARELLEHSAGRKGAAARSDAQRILGGAEQMRALIQDLLAYSHLRSADLEVERVALGSVVAEVLAQLQADVQDRRAQVSVREPLPAVVGHHTTLVQVVANLLANAIKYAAPGAQPRVRIWAEAPDQWVRLWVEDHGIGIAPEHHERIFRAFERLHDEKVYPGTGIGLAIVRKGIERMGGRVGLESTPGQGSRFWVELPKP
jgi:signal transduction histidine kinase